MKIIAHIENDFTEKFGVPRQSGLTPVASRIVFEKEYRVKEAFRGLEGFSYLWIIWKFSEAEREDWSPTVRPPRLGGNKRMGVFATRSPFRPNPVGLSSVRIIKIDMDCSDAPVIYVEGADMMNGTPIYDIKPYLPYTDSHPDAKNGFALSSTEAVLDVVFPEELKKLIPAEKYEALISILSQDPRPQYKDDGDRVYTMSYGGYDIGFVVENGRLIVKNIDKL